MPCRDHQEDWGTRNLDAQEKCDELAAMLCTACKLLESKFIAFEDTAIIKWWANHQESDRHAREEEKLHLKAMENIAEIKARFSTTELEAMGIFI